MIRAGKVAKCRFSHEKSGNAESLSPSVMFLNRGIPLRLAHVCEWRLEKPLLGFSVLIFQLATDRTSMTQPQEGCKVAGVVWVKHVIEKTAQKLSGLSRCDLQTRHFKLSIVKP